MEEEKERRWSKAGIMTNILEGLEGVSRVIPWPEASGNASMYKVLDINENVSYVIKQYHKPKLEDGLEFQERAKNEKEISDSLCQYSSYVGQVIEVKSEERPLIVGGPLYVNTEVLLKYGGMDLMQFRKQNTVNKFHLIDVIVQSALAITTAHQHGIFHSDIKPRNMLFNGFTLKLIDFDVSTQMGKERLVDKYRLSLTSVLKGHTEAYCPPELLLYDSDKKEIPINPGKIDSYCWAMSMFQFLTGYSMKELAAYTQKIKNSPEDCSSILEKIKKHYIKALGEKNSPCVMKLLARCLEYSPHRRITMDDVLACLIDPNEEYLDIINSLPDKKGEKYLLEIRTLLGKPDNVTSIFVEEKGSTPKEIVPEIRGEINLKKTASYNFSASGMEESSPNEKMLPKGIIISNEKIIAYEKMQSMREFPSSNEFMEEKGDSKSEEVGNQIDPLLEPAFKQIKLLFANEHIFGNPLYKKIALSQEEAMYLDETKLDCGIVAAGLMKNSTTLTLSLVNKPIGAKGVQFISVALVYNLTLTTLFLSDCNIGEQGAAFLAVALKSNSTLTELVLWENNIGIKGAGFIANGLKSNSTLTKIDLMHNNIGEKGAEGLASALKVNSTLTALKLDNNNIRMKGTEFIATALLSNSTLSELNLEENNIGDLGALFISAAIKSNSSLMELNLKNNNISDKGAEYIASALKSNYSLTLLDMQSNNITKNGELLIQQNSAIHNTCKVNFSGWFESI